MIARNKIALITGSQEFTGSIERIQAMGPYDATSSIQNIEFGVGDHASTVTHSMDIPNGHSILGPARTVKGLNGEWLVFHS